MPTQQPKSVDLVQYTCNLLNNRPRGLTIEKIVEDTGLTKGWLNAMATGVHPEPSAVKIQRLYEYLSGEKLLKNDK